MITYGFPRKSARLPKKRQITLVMRVRLLSSGGLPAPELCAADELSRRTSHVHSQLRRVSFIEFQKTEFTCRLSLGSGAFLFSRAPHVSMPSSLYLSSLFFPSLLQRAGSLMGKFQCAFCQLPISIQIMLSSWQRQWQESSFNF